MTRCKLLAFFAVFAMGSAAAKPLPFKHIIVVVQENRTPDNLFGSNPNFEPGVDISSKQVLSTGQTVSLTPVPLALCYDVNHTHESFESALKRGFDAEPYSKNVSRCSYPAHPQYTYVDNSSGTVTPYFDIALANGFANRMFQTNQGPSFPAHQFLFGGTSAPSVSTPLFAAENPTGGGQSGCDASARSRVALIDKNGKETTNKPIYPCFEHPVLSDLLDNAANSITWRYYAQSSNGLWTAPNAIRHVCGPQAVGGKTVCKGAEWLKNVVPDDASQALSDIMNCKLQAVSWVTPTAAESDHAQINDGTGPSWVASIVNAVGSTTCRGERYWDDTAIFITWDDWGGWADHVAPFKVTNATAWGAGYTYGFRVPLLVVSAYTPPGQVSNSVFDFGSILLYIERNFGLGYIGSGATIYDDYADYQAAGSTRGNLEEFFGLILPKAFVAIPSAKPPQYFLDAPKTLVSPDDD